MNASELYAIVKDVPKEAWPDISWCNGAWFETDRDGLIHRHSLSLEVETSVLMFEASMMRWLCRTLMAKKGMPHVLVVAPEDDDDRWRVFRSDRTHCIGVENTFVEALAAACKAVAQ